jgi:DNA-binding NarL/FixJ family response regulator
MPTLIAFAEDNAINRKTFINKVNHHPDLSIVIMAVNGNDFLAQLKGLPFDKHPAVVFMDLEMPEMDGVQTITIAKALYPDIQFIVLTVFDDEEKIFEAIRAGASGYLLKNETADTLREAVDNVLIDGGVPMSAAIARKAMEMLSKSQWATTTSTSSSTKSNDLGAILSSREKEILQYTIKGLDAKRIADILNLSVCTVRKHTANIYLRLHVNSKAQVIHLAHELKWFNN